MLPLQSLLAIAGALCVTVEGLIPIEIKGKRFLQPSTDARLQGKAYFAAGIDYLIGGASGYDSSSGEDALSNPEVCYRDAYVFQQLGINTVRIYSLNADLNHDECMTILNNAGIYVVLDVNSGEYGSHLNRAEPWTTYNSQYLGHVFRFIEAFKNYPNVLGFFSGNEIINDQNNYASITPKYVRAVQRDMKQYIANHSNRTIPVGYSAADGIELRRATLEYMQCHIDGEDDNISRADFFGLNSYEWCSGMSDWTTSGYDKLNSTMSNTSIPLIFSEFGCNTHRPRTFDEISDGLFGGLVNTFSGGLVYEYSQEASDYGVVEVDSDGQLTYLTDFSYLSNQYHNVTIPTIYEDNIEDIDAPECDADRITAIYPDFGADFNLPDQPDEIAMLIQYGVNSTNTGKLLDGLNAKASNYTIYDASSSEVPNATVTFLDDNEVNSQSGVSTSSKQQPTSTSSPTATAAASTSRSSSSKGIAAAVAPSLSGVLFALISYIL
jgi:hypothetical protein